MVRRKGTGLTVPSAGWSRPLNMPFPDDDQIGCVGPQGRGIGVRRDGRPPSGRGADRAWVRRLPMDECHEIVLLKSSTGVELTCMCGGHRLLLATRHAVVLRDGPVTGRVELACRCGWTAWAADGAEADRLATRHESNDRTAPGGEHLIAIRPDHELEAVAVVCSCGSEWLVERFADAHRAEARHRLEVGIT